MYKRILVPTDGSETATLGLKEAIRLAQVHAGQIRVLHVVDEFAAAVPDIYGPVLEQLGEQLRKVGHTALTTARAMVDNAGVKVDTKLVEAFGGPAGEHIIKEAQDWPADVIVCGTHGRRGVRRIVMGSDAEFIVRRSPVPILLVRAQQT